MTGSACPIGASAKADAFIIIQNQIILLNLFSGGTAFPRSPSHSVEKLTFVIAISRACLLVSRTRTRRRDARARARSTQVPRALAHNINYRSI